MASLYWSSQWYWWCSQAIVINDIQTKLKIWVERGCFLLFSCTQKDLELCNLHYKIQNMKSKHIKGRKGRKTNKLSLSCWLTVRGQLSKKMVLDWHLVTQRHQSRPGVGTGSVLTGAASEETVENACLGGWDLTRARRQQCLPQQQRR